MAYWVGRTRAIDVDDLAVLVEAGSVSEGQKDTTGRPRELVAQRVARVLGCGETTAVRQERSDLAALLVDLIDGLDSVQVVDTGV